MKIVGFIWLEEIVQKLIWRHSVEVTDVSELFSKNLASILLKKDSERAKMYMRHMGDRMTSVI